jgi:hypothetical protein
MNKLARKLPDDSAILQKLSGKSKGTARPLVVATYPLPSPQMSPQSK